MNRRIITHEEAAELTRLYEEHAAASQRAGEILQSHGMESAEFADADRATGELWRRIREILP